MSMVFCRGCGKEMHQTALVCPTCGVSQNDMQSQVKHVGYTSYEQVPWFRKNWFIVLGALIFAPVTLYSLFSGDIYYEKKGQLATYSKLVKTITIVLCLWLSGWVLQGSFDMLRAGGNKPSVQDISTDVQKAWAYLCPQVEVGNFERINGINNGQSYRLAFSYRIDIKDDLSPQDGCLTYLKGTLKSTVIKQIELGTWHKGDAFTVKDEADMIKSENGWIRQ